MSAWQKTNWEDIKSFKMPKSIEIECSTCQLIPSQCIPNTCSVHNYKLWKPSELICTHTNCNIECKRDKDKRCFYHSPYFRLPNNIDNEIRRWNQIIIASTPRNSDMFEALSHALGEEYR